MNEGAGILMVKPGMPYLDIVREVKDKVRMLLEGDNLQPKSACVECRVWQDGGGGVGVGVGCACCCVACLYVLIIS